MTGFTLYQLLFIAWELTITVAYSIVLYRDFPSERFSTFLTWCAHCVAPATIVTLGGFFR